MEQNQVSLFDNNPKEELQQEEKVVLPINSQENDIEDIELDFSKKKKFRINKDSNLILEIDVADLGVINRFEEIYPRLKELDEKAQEIIKENSADQEGLSRFAKRLKNLDSEMRELLDKIFQANVSETCAPTGTMYDVINGSSRFEHIFSTISGLYEKNINAETQKVKAKISKYTDKYTK